MPLKTLPGTLDSLGTIRGIVTGAAQAAGLDAKRTYDLCLAVDEIATNVVMHGYEEAGRTGTLQVDVETTPAELRVVLEDQGAPYDPKASELPEEKDVSRPIEEREIGGLGLFLAYRGVDEIQYESSGGTNRHVFIVRLSSDSRA